MVGSRPSTYYRYIVEEFGASFIRAGVDLYKIKALTTSISQSGIEVILILLHWLGYHFTFHVHLTPYIAKQYGGNKLLLLLLSMTIAALAAAILAVVFAATTYWIKLRKLAEAPLYCC
jgi:hypothetical protein